MWVRRLFHRWLFPAALVLPLWLLIGWGVSGAGGWAFFWVLLLAMPSVFVGQLVLALLVRARGTVRAERAVSWPDVAGFALWHGLVVSLAFFAAPWWGVAVVLAVLVGIALFWLELWQLWREAGPLRIAVADARASGLLAGDGSGRTGTSEDVIIIEEGSPRRGH
jgi:hypothetical protein